MNSILPVIFKRKLFLLLSLGFLVAALSGMYLHECGHYMAAKCFGYDAHIVYNYTYWWENPKTSKFNDSIFAKYNSNVALEKNDSLIKQKYFDIIKKEQLNNFWITWGGPIETMLTGTAGFIFLIAYKKLFKASAELIFRQWLMIFIALFWLRQPANLFTGLFGKFIFNRPPHSDEIEIANYLQLPEWSVSGITGLIGFAVCAIIIFYFIPLKQRFTFIISGTVGGGLGIILSFLLTEPRIMT